MNNNRDKKIAQNSAVLYFRLLITMAISLYTSRVVLNVLGVDDFGIFNVVGGFISMFAILTNSLSQSISRFMNYALGKQDLELQKRVFSTSINIHVLFSIVLFVLIEIAGSWFISNKINVPQDRINVLNVVFQLALINFVFNIYRVTFIGLIIVHEYAKAYAWFSIAESVFKLLAILSLSYFSNIDFLILYVLLLLIINVFVTIGVAFFCYKNFNECNYKFVYDSCLLKKMISFSGWTVVGKGSYIFCGYGINTILNVFWGVGVNAARGIATQIDGATRQFVYNVTMAVNPQIIKSYSENNHEYMAKLVCKGAKYTLFVMVIYMVPLICETEYLLSLWLGFVPDSAVLFTRLAFLEAVFYVLSLTLNTAIQASGNIRNFQLLSGLGFGLSVFVCYILFSLGLAPYFAYVVSILTNFLVFIIALLCAKRVAGVPIIPFVREVLIKGGVIVFFSFIIPFLIVYILSPSIARFVLTALSSISISIILIYTLGMGRSEKKMIKGVIYQYINSYKRK